MSDFLSNPATAQDDRPEISALAGTVVSLMRDKSERKAERHLRDMTDLLLERVRAPGPFSVEKLVAEMLASGLHTDQIIDICIPWAAREMGEMWCSDQMGFAEVTIGSSRLQGLLTVLAPPWGNAPGDDNDPALVLVIPEGDTHTLGPHVVTAQLRRMNVSVRVIFGPSCAALPRILRSDPYDGVFFSCSRQSKLETIAEMISRVKSSVTGAPPTILGGLVLELAEKESEKVGADFMTNNARAALQFCRSQMETGASKAR